MRPGGRRAFLFFVFPKLTVIQCSFDCIKFLCNFKRNKTKMRLSMKLGIGSLCTMLFIIGVGFVAFPKLITSKVKGMVSLKSGNDIRGMFLKVPFALTFRVYLFNVTNPMEVQKGEKPTLAEVGPFCYEEWKEKVNVEDIEADDTILYNPKDTFIQQMWPGCLSGTQEITIPHPMILGVVNAVAIKKPGALTLVNKAIKSIYSNPTSIFVTAKANDILFDGIIINCEVGDFAGKAICGQFKEAPTLKKISENELGFSLLAPKNATPGKRIKAYRGIKNYRDLGRIVEYDGAETMDVWPTAECNEIRGTDGTIFPPLLKPEDGLVSYAPDLCRSLAAFYVGNTKYDGIPVREYSANLGDMSENEDEKCYCPTPDTCLKKGIMDLYKCMGIPMYASLPHFYDSDEIYVKGVNGLSPNKTKHEIKILFEPITGSPVYAKKRLQFSMPLQPNAKVDLFNNFTETILPLFWIEEGVELNITYTKQLKDFFKIKKVVKISSWLILVTSLGGMAGAGYLFFRENGKAVISPVHSMHTTGGIKSAISTVNGNRLEGHVNHGMTNHESDKF